MNMIEVGNYTVVFWPLSKINIVYSPNQKFIQPNGNIQLFTYKANAIHSLSTNVYKILVSVVC